MYIGWVKLVADVGDEDVETQQEPALQLKHERQYGVPNVSNRWSFSTDDGVM